jgi:hypothetical protein
MRPQATIQPTYFALSKLEVSLVSVLVPFSARICWNKLAQRVRNETPSEYRPESLSLSTERGDHLAFPFAHQDHFTSDAYTVLAHQFQFSSVNHIFGLEAL